MLGLVGEVNVTIVIGVLNDSGLRIKDGDRKPEVVNKPLTLE